LLSGQQPPNGDDEEGKIGETKDGAHVSMALYCSPSVEFRVCVKCVVRMCSRPHLAVAREETLVLFF
jgi:hypothetical protein